MFFGRTLLLPLFFVGLLGCHRAPDSRQVPSEDPFSLTPAEKAIFERFEKHTGKSSLGLVKPANIDFHKTTHLLIPNWSEELSEQFRSYLKKSGTTPSVEAKVFQYVANRYYKAIKIYGDNVTTTCRGRNIEGSGWTTRLIDRFGKDAVRKDLDVIRLSLATAMVTARRACEAEATRQLLAADSEYRFVLFDRYRKMLKFIETRGARQKAALEPGRRNLHAMISAYRKYSFSAILPVRKEIELVAKSKDLPQRYMDFFTKDRSFQAPFKAYRALKELEATL